MYTHVYNYDPLLLVDLLPMVSCLYPAITTQAGGSGMGWGGGWFRLPGNTLIHILANYIYVGYCTQSVYTYIYIYNIMHKNRNINISYIYIYTYSFKADIWKNSNPPLWIYRITRWHRSTLGHSSARTVWRSAPMPWKPRPRWTAG